jgi:choline dehydrogenase-like flavoprotein
MRIDGTEIAANTTIETDVCIVGAGPAGLTLAHRLMEGRRRIHVLEAGGERAIDSVDALCLEPSGSPLEPAGDSRWRQVSGTASIWNVRLRNRPAGRYVPLASVDFEQRRGLPYSGWPFGRETLEPYYSEAERVAVYGMSQGQPTGAAQPEVFDLDPAVVTTTLETFGFGTVFTEDLPGLLIRHPNVILVTRAMVVQITVNSKGNRAEELCVVSGRSTFRVRFRLLVLAAGGIENARLLLVSRVAHPDGLGNDHGLVGRFFMDHPRVRLGYLKPSDSRVFERASAYDIRLWNGRYLGGKLTLAEEVLRSRGLLNASVQLLPHPSASDAQSLNSLKLLMARLRRGNVDREATQRAREVLRGIRYILSTGAPLAVTQRRAMPVISDGGWSRLPGNRERFEYFELVLQSEQSPDPENRVTVGNSTDEFGLPRPCVTSRWTEKDIWSIRETARILTSELEKTGVGRFVPVGNRLEPQLYQVGGAHHHMGTTRMHTDHRQGVVDENSRVHGISNVYVAGSSVFPTGGYANPTLTLLALTLRLADHLTRTLLQ